MKINEIFYRDLDRASHSVPLAALDGKSICITGATGLIGSALADLLLYFKCRLGCSVEVTLTARSEEKLRKRFPQWEGSYSALHFECGKAFPTDRHFDFLVHCAENAHPQTFSAYPVETAQTAIAGASALLTYTAHSGGRFCYVSSSEVYGKLNKEGLIRETDFGEIALSDARSCYPSAKRMNETLCACYKKEYGVDYIVMRPGHIFGPSFTKEDSRAFAQFARDVLSGRDIVMKSEGRQLRSHCYALDCASAILTAALLGESGEAYNISNINSVSTIRELAETFARVSGRKVVFELPSEAERAGYNRMTYSALDSAKLDGLGWKGQFDLESGVRSTLSCAEL